MYDLNPLQVFVHKRVYEDEKATIRLEKMLKGLGNPPFEEVDVRDTDEVIEAAGMTEDLHNSEGNSPWNLGCKKIQMMLSRC